ncbi:DMT family transporter [Terricaulis sp.]|uniref:DMT family transporter n=1 Tax=Terricaulis sp. TaxID=2768686 RepID=UPI0037834D26
MSGQPVAFYVALSLLGGVLIPVTAALSGVMGRSLGNHNLAALIVITGSFLMVLAYTLATGSAAFSLETLRRVPALQLCAGLGIAFYLISITYVGPRFGVGNAVMFVLAGQIISSALIDHFGLFGAPQKPIDLLRAAGLIVMITGVVIAQIAANNAKPVAH